MTPLDIFLGILMLIAGLLAIVAVAVLTVWLLHLFLDVIPEWVRMRR